MFICNCYLLCILGILDIWGISGVWVFLYILYLGNSGILDYRYSGHYICMCISREGARASPQRLERNGRSRHRLRGGRVRISRARAGPRTRTHTHTHTHAQVHAHAHTRTNRRTRAHARASRASRQKSASPPCLRAQRFNDSRAHECHGTGSMLRQKSTPRAHATGSCHGLLPRSRAHARLRPPFKNRSLQSLGAQAATR